MTWIYMQDFNYINLIFLQYSIKAINESKYFFENNNFNEICSFI